VSRSIDDLAKIVQAPPPDVLSLAKKMTGVTEGVDDQGDLAIVFTSVEPGPHQVLLMKVADFAAFFAALKVVEPSSGVVEVQLAGTPHVVGRKGDYAVLAAAANRDALERLLAATDNLADDASLVEWVDTNQASFVLTPTGLKQLLPKLIAAIRAFQEQVRQSGNEQAKPAADAMEMYAQLFTAAAPQVEQFALGVRIEADRSIEIAKRLQLVPGGEWAKWAAAFKPARENLFSRMLPGRFVFVMAGSVPQEVMTAAMGYSVKIMQSQPMYQLSPEQAEKYTEASLTAMTGVRSMQMLMGVPEPGAGLYGNTTVVMAVDDSQRFLKNYSEAIAQMQVIAEESKSPAIPAMSVKQVPFGEAEAMEISMDMSHLNQLATPGGPDPQKMMQAMMGPGGKLNIYLAAADAQTVVISYTSLERLKAAIDFFNSKQPGLADDPGIAKVSAKLPAGSQFVAFVSLDGAAQAARQTVLTVTRMPVPPIPEIASNPPIGIAAKFSGSGVDGELIVTAETIKAVGDTIAKVRAAFQPPKPPQPQQ
jgi:hypothetical protein